MAKDQDKHEDDFRGDADLLFASKYIRAADLQGKDVKLTIARCEKNAELIKAGGAKELKPVMHFEETDKMMVLNKTNKNAIAALHGRTVADWVGKKIVLYPAPFRGEQKCIRVRDS